jgi:hypothetical protein
MKASTAGQQRLLDQLIASNREGTLDPWVMFLVVPSAAGGLLISRVGARTIELDDPALLSGLERSGLIRFFEDSGSARRFNLTASALTSAPRRPSSPSSPAFHAN